jgi:adenylate cyclase
MSALGHIIRGMAISSDVQDGVDDVLDADWSARDGTVVPKTEDIVLKNGAVNIDATYVYADLADSSSLGQKVADEVAAKVVRAYLNAASRILRNYNGHIRSFDGDRVMAIFIGGSKNSNAVRAALALNWAMDEVIAPSLETRWPTLKDLWAAKHGVGIDTGSAMLVRGGVRDNSDLVSIGSAPNVAAKLSDLRCAKIHITERVHDRTKQECLVSSDGTTSMWTLHTPVEVAGISHAAYWSDWRWTP